jgi:hypothetical protein
MEPVSLSGRIFYHFVLMGVNLAASSRMAGAAKEKDNREIKRKAFDNTGDIMKLQPELS